MALIATIMLLTLVIIAVFVTKRNHTYAGKKCTVLNLVLASVVTVMGFITSSLFVIELLQGVTVGILTATYITTVLVLISSAIYTIKTK